MEIKFGLIFSADLILSFILVISAAYNNYDQETKVDKLLGIHSNKSSKRCRNRDLRLYDELSFYWESCVQCYFYMPGEYFHPNEKLGYFSDGSTFGRLLRINATGTSRYLFFENEEHRAHIAATINSEKGLNLWYQCCEAARRCCQKMMDEPEQLMGKPHCGRQWDGWQCIPDSPTDTTIEVSCPSYIYFFGDPPTAECSNYGSKICYSNGVWSEKTDYTSCGQTNSLKRRTYVNIGAFTFSIIFLIPAVIIFTAYKQLKVPRVAMHTNLFIALVINGIVVIIFKSVISLNALEKGSESNSIVGRNSVECKFALALTKYTRMTTYMWMLCEGFYLHKLIVTAFAEEQKLLVYYIIGWVFPVIPVALYALMRKLYADKQCWMVPEGGYEWILNAPMLISLAYNNEKFEILRELLEGDTKQSVISAERNKTRVLITKLQAAHSNETIQYRKAVRAIVVLVPLFGLHFLLTIYLPNHGACGAVEFYYYFSYLIDGLQGFIVSLIFCYLNGDVLSLLARSFNTYRLQQKLGSERSRTCTHDEAKDKMKHSSLL